MPDHSLRSHFSRYASALRCILAITGAMALPSCMYCLLIACTCSEHESCAGQAGFVANMADIAPGSAGQMFGLCGTFASLAGIIATSSVGFIVEKTGAALKHSPLSQNSRAIDQPPHDSRSPIDIPTKSVALLQALSTQSSNLLPYCTCLGPQSGTGFAPGKWFSHDARWHEGSLQSPWHLAAFRPASMGGFRGEFDLRSCSRSKQDTARRSSIPTKH